MMVTPWSIIWLAAHEPTVSEEVVGLQALYHSTYGAQWSNNDRWLTGDPCGVPPFYCGESCKGWHGVHCWGPGGHVRKLQQRNFRVHGTLPTELGNLRQLAALDLPGAGLSGTLPSELALVPFRRTVSDDSLLSLGGHRISGSFPAELAISLPDDLPTCRLPPSVECSRVGLPLACRSRHRAGKGRSAPRHLCAATDAAPHTACPPPARQSNSSAAATAPDQRHGLATLPSAAHATLCAALRHLGLAPTLPAASAAEALVHSGLSSLSSFIAAPARAIVGSLKRRTMGGTGDTAASIPAAATLTQPSLPPLPNRTVTHVLKAQAALRQQAALERRWASHVDGPAGRRRTRGPPGVDGALVGLRRRLAKCCVSAPVQRSVATDGSWLTRKMHPCCAPLASKAALSQAVARGGGERSRLERVVAKLRRGLPITVVALGGSISTAQYAGCTDQIPGAADPAAKCRHGHGWARSFIDFLSAVWPPHATGDPPPNASMLPPAPRHRLFAFGRTGAAADTFVDCVTTHLDALGGEADLFLLEFAINGASSAGTSAAPLEALVRRLLTLRGGTRGGDDVALLGVSFFPWLAHKATSWMRPLPIFPASTEMRPMPAATPGVERFPLSDFLAPFSDVLPDVVGPRRGVTAGRRRGERGGGGGWRGAAKAAVGSEGRTPHPLAAEEDPPPELLPLDRDQLRLQEQVDAIYSYYGLPLVSVRDGLMPSFLSGDLHPLDWLRWNDFGFHPPPALQAFVASALLDAVWRATAISDAIITAESSSTHAHAQDEERAALEKSAAEERGGERTIVLPAPLHDGMLRLSHPLACYVWGINYQANWRHYGYRMLAPPPTLSSEGWYVSLEQRVSRAGTTRSNPGLVANSSGAALVVKLDTTRAALVGHTDGGGGGGLAGTPMVQLEYLTSYDGGMGTLEMRCIQGCTCPPAVSFDAHTPGERSSRHVLGCVPVSAHRECHVRLAVAGATSSGGHKFVLHALRVLLEHPTTAAAHLSPRPRALPRAHARASAELARWRCDPSLPLQTHAFMSEQAGRQD
jgi:hypothetical protein